MKKILQTVTVVCFLVLIFGFTLAFLLLPDHSFSQEENRSLQTFPKLSFESLASGEFSARINDYFADQFPLRNTLVGLKGGVEIALGKGENNGVLLGEGGNLGKRLFNVMLNDGRQGKDLDACSEEHLSGAVDGINRVSETLDVPLDVLLTGRNLDVAASAFSYPSNYSDAMLAYLRENISDGVNYLDTVPMYREKFDAGEEVYYRTDHHWTTLGAYYAYAEILRSYGMEGEILPMEVFDRRVMSDRFYGTSWSAGGMKFVPADKIEFWYLGNEDEFTVTADSKPLDGFYSMKYLSVKDKYSAFLDGTHDVVTVRKNTEEERPVLLLFKDSFANSLAPFLAQHFDLVLLNLSSTRTDYTDLTRYVEEYHPDRVLVVYTVENVMTADKLNRLR